MRIVWGALLALTLLAAPAGAAGDEGLGLRRYVVEVRGGAMRLEFHGDEATGCERRGLCDVSGTVSSRVTATEPGFAFLTTARGYLIGSIAAFVRGTSHAVVHTPGAPDCKDVAARSIDSYTLAAAPGRPGVVGLGTSSVDSLGEGGGVSFGGSGSDDFFGTRCAGPSLDDIQGALPRAFVKRSWLLRRHFTVRLSRLRTFTSGGFTGTITSNVRLRFTRPTCAGSKRARRYCRDFDDALTNSS